VSVSHELELANAFFSSPCASSPWRSVNVVVTSVPIVASVPVTVETAVSTPVTPETPLTALSIVSTSFCRLVESWSSESFACWPAWVSGLPSPFRSEARFCVADFASSAAVCNPFFDGSFFTEPAADVIADCHVVIDEQTPFAQVSVAEAVVVVVEPPPLEPHPVARIASAAPATTNASKERDTSPSLHSRGALTTSAGCREPIRPASARIPFSLGTFGGEATRYKQHEMPAHQHVLGAQFSWASTRHWTADRQRRHGVCVVGNHTGQLHPVAHDCLTFAVR